MPATSPMRSSSNPSAARAVREAPARAASRASSPAPAATIASTRSSICALSASRSMVIPKRRVGTRTSLAHSSESSCRCGSAPSSRSSSERTIRLRSVGSIAAAAPGARAPSSSCSAAGPRAATSASIRARSSGGGGGCRERSVRAARRFRPVPPTTIGRRPLARARSISACASGMKSPTENVSDGSRKPIRR